MKPAKKKLKEELAFKLYCSCEYTRKEIAEKVDITEATLRRWIDAGSWDDYAVSLSMSKDGQIKMMMAQLKELNEHIAQKEEGKRYADTKEADAMMKITKAIKDLESELGISETVNVMRKFLVFARVQDKDLASQIKDIGDQFIHSLIKD